MRGHWRHGGWFAAVTVGFAGWVLAQGNVEYAPNVQPEIVRAIEAKLQRIGCPGTVRVFVLDDPVATLRIERLQPDGVTVSRSVPLPERAKERGKVAAHLAFNMCSNEAEAFLRRDAGPGEGERPLPEVADPEDSSAGPTAEPSPEPETAKATPPLSPTPPPVPHSVAHSPCEDTAFAPASFSIVTPLGVPLGAPSTSFLFGTIYGRTRSLRGVALGTIVHTQCKSHGASASLAATFAQNDFAGFLGSTGFVFSFGKLRGGALAPIVWTDKAEGVTLGALNLATGTFTGGQLGAVNVGVADATVFQVGVINVNLGTMQGGQLGLINVGHHVKGTQVGLLNIAGRSDASFGLQSIAWLEPIRPYLGISTERPLQFGVLWGGKNLFSQLGLARTVQRLVEDRELVLEVDLGLQLLKNDRAGVFVDALVGIEGKVDENADCSMNSLRAGVRAGYRIFPRFAPYMYGGVAGTVKTFEDEDVPIPEVGAGLLF